jgi:hypothetical protein
MLYFAQVLFAFRYDPLVSSCSKRLKGHGRMPSQGRVLQTPRLLGSEIWPRKTWLRKDLAKKDLAKKVRAASGDATLPLS